MSDNTRECGKCGGVMRVYDENKSKTRFKCDTCKKTRDEPKPQTNRLY